MLLYFALRHMWQTRAVSTSAASWNTVSFLSLLSLNHCTAVGCNVSWHASRHAVALLFSEMSSSECNLEKVSSGRILILIHV